MTQTIPPTSAPRFDAPDGASESTHTFATFDGTPLFYRQWLTAGPAERAVVLFHRGHEHSGRLTELAAALAGAGTAVFAWDQRGHGQSPGERGYADSFGDIVRDIDCFISHIRGAFNLPMEQIAVVGHSVGAVVVAAWVHDYAPQVRAMVLATPAFRVKLYVPFAIPALRARMLLGVKSFVKSYVKPGMITRDPDQARAYASDPLISRNIAVNILLDLFDTSTRLLADAPAIRTPTLILSAGNDWVVKNSAQQQFFDRLSSPTKQLVKFDKARHAIFHDADRQQAFAQVKSFLNQAFAQPPIDHSELLRADEAGYTKEEYDRLRCPRAVICPKRWNFAVQTLTLKTIGRLSEGVRLGWRTGFDSGESLDYVYENTPRGITPLGRFIDRQYLDAIGWRGIRLRKQNIQSMLRRAIDERLARGEPVRLLDIAAGGGRYTLEVLAEYRNRDVSAVLRDRSPGALAVGRATAQKLGLSRVTFVEADAFDRASIAAVEPKPNILMVSGLYELFPDNTLLKRSLAGLADAGQPGATLIYTGQPWHPQIEMIARVLTNREGAPWIMRRRTQLEMDQLVAAAGFQKQRTLTDPWGIFTVSSALR